MKVRFALAITISLSLVLSLPSYSLRAEDKDDAAANTPPSRSLPALDIFDQEKSTVETVADSIEYLREEKKVIAKGNVLLRHGDVKLTADYAEVQTDTKQVYAKGHIIFFRHDTPLAKGDEVHYNFATKQGTFPDGRFISFPWFLTGDEIKQVKDGVKEITNASVTTCDRDDLHFDVRAKEVTIYDDDKLIAKNVRIYILGKPVFWWPYFIIPLHEELRDIPFAVRAGYNDRFGGFILLTKGISISQNVGGKLHFDWRSKRGFGAGIDIDYNYGPIAKGIIKTYLTKDKRAPTPTATNPFEELEDRSRGRFTWIHRTEFGPHTNIIGRYSRLADEFFLQEFFQKENRSEIEPQSFVTFTKNSEHHGFLTHLEKRVNKFESLVQRLPMVQFVWKNQPFLNSGLFYESQTEFAQLNKTFPRTSVDEEVTRFDNFHEWTAPIKWNHINFTPTAKIRGTYYSRERDSSDAQFRVIYGTGLDIRTQYYKTTNAEFDKFGIELNKVRHIIEPFFNVDSSFSTVSDETLAEFDPVDRLDDAHILTVGLENRFQTKRVINGKMRRVDFVSLNTFLSYELHPDGRARASKFAPFIDGRRASNFTILGQELVLRPYQWLFYQARFEYDMEKDRFRVFNQDLTLTKGRGQILFGHRFIQDFAASEGSNQFIFEGKYRLNDLWSFGGYIRWDPQDARDVEEWQISASRDLHDFLLDFGYNVRESDIDSSNSTLFFNLYLKAFPLIGIHGGANSASFSGPRIGDTVAGSNPFNEGPKTEI